jgi:phosphoglycerol transferase MdoB-like AlkP superfamily enzyme
MAFRIKQNIYIALIQKLFIILFLFILSRIIFYLFNFSHFTNISAKSWLLILLGGLRFDISAIFIINLPFIFLQAIPINFRNTIIYRRISKILFLTINSIALLANCIDFIYFRFTLKRITSDFFSLFSMGEDMQNTLPQMIGDFWYVAVIWVLLIILMAYLYKNANYYDKKKYYNLKYYLRNTVFLLIVSFISIIGIRGGFQLKPINIITANLYAEANNVPLVLNTPFTIIKTFNNSALEKVKYFNDEKEVKEYYNPIHDPIANSKLKTQNSKFNVVIIILESFSKEHIYSLAHEHISTLAHEKSITPFLDSLIHQSLAFPNAFANGRRSIEGIPAVLAGIPMLMTNPFISSAYSGNKFYSLPYLLKQEGYNTSFYHGGSNGTMGFDNFCMAAGIDKYYGRNEYNNDRDFDGNWGIFDEPFLQYFARSLDMTRQPFLSAVFTLSSHHPFTLPEKYKNRFTIGNKFQRSISYADYALKRFFDTASRMKWFDNTIFVITADHSSEIYNKSYDNRLGEYAIPIIYYRHKPEIRSQTSDFRPQTSGLRPQTSDLKPQTSDLKGFDSTITQQIDIMPSILDYIHYDKPYFAFGNSVFKKNNLTTYDLRLTTNFAISFLNDSYQLITADYVLQFDGKKFNSIYDRKTDPSLKHNLLNQLPPSDFQLPASSFRLQYLENLMKAIIQTYNQRMIDNKLTLSN